MVDAFKEGARWKQSIGSIREDVDQSWRKLTQCFRECDLGSFTSDVEQYFRNP